jgi:hypothetical protein
MGRDGPVRRRRLDHDGDRERVAHRRPAQPGHVPPRWPDPAYPQQAHLDLRVPDLDAGSAKAVELGAELLRKNENWYTLSARLGAGGLVTFVT